MKMLLGFFIGMTCGLLVVLFVFRGAGLVAADSKAPVISYDNNGSAPVADDATSPATDTADPTLNGLLPDIKKIYNNALSMPYRQVESEITDPDIAKFFHAYMDATGLDKDGVNP